ncbi:MAG: hypothetical protein JSW10_12650 [Pseudomonadota bacterium]|nr:MAG: hypothetical protein JSW10_12650 [Pseudomonadota bacterium]
MERITRALYIAPVAILLSITPAHAAHGESEISEWQKKRLFSPTAAQVERENKGQVFIYDGLTDKEVERAVEEEYDRLHAIMFTGIVVTDARGEPMRDPVTGELLFENDGCDY